MIKITQISSTLKTCHLLNPSSCRNPHPTHSLLPVIYTSCPTNHIFVPNPHPSPSSPPRNPPHSTLPPRRQAPVQIPRPIRLNPVRRARVPVRKDAPIEQRPCGPGANIILESRVRTRRRHWPPIGNGDGAQVRRQGQAVWLLQRAVVAVSDRADGASGGVPSVDAGSEDGLAVELKSK